MKAGDIVKFFNLKANEGYMFGLGLLIKYEKWEKVATVLYKGELIRIRAGHITKAGKNDRQLARANKQKE